MHVTVPQYELSALKDWLLRQSLSSVKVHQFRNLSPSSVGAKDPIVDVMTGEPVGGTLTRARFIAAHRYEDMVRDGLHPIRVKVACPALEYPQSDEEGYYETHMRILGVRWHDSVPHDLASRRVLVSRSLRTMEWHATVRSEGCSFQSHHDRVSHAARLLAEHGIHVVERPRHEYVELDSNRAHDARWEGRRQR